MKKLLCLWLCCIPGISSADDPYPEWTLYSPFAGTSTFLIDLNGDVAHSWTSSFTPGVAVYLLDSGRLLRCCNDSSVQPFVSGGVGGRLQILSWDGVLEWNYVAAGPDYVQHHDAIVLPNGNILTLVWERFSQAEAIAAGRNPAFAPGQILSEAIIEIEPVGATGGNIVWEWHLWDHLVQDFNPTLPNFGDPSDFPGRVDINFPGGALSDWIHLNGLDYNAELDQIVVGSTQFDELWIISHDPTDSGELRYRWGNPAAYGRGLPAEQVLEGQHNPQWIRAGLPGAGNLMLYNNGTERGYSSVDEITPPLNPDGTYALAPSQPYGPTNLTDSCDTINGQQFFSSFISGVQRLANGNTLVCVGASGNLFEVDQGCASVWSFAVGGPTFRATRIGAVDPRLEGLLWFVSDDEFLRGDINGDGQVNGLGDSLFALNAQFVPGSPQPSCLKAADVDDNGAFQALNDVLYLLNFSFLNGTAPATPYPSCGIDGLADALTCDTTPCP